MAPGHGSAHQVHVRDRLAHDLPAGHVEDVQRPVLGAVLRQRDRDPAIRGRHEEVDGGLAGRVDDVRIHHHPLGSGSSRSVSATRNGCCRGVCTFSAKKMLPPDRSCLYVVRSDFSSR